MEVSVASTVLLVDDDSVIRAALKKRLDLENDLKVVGEAADGRVAIEIAALYQPDVVVIDNEMPTMNGISAMPGLRAASPASRIIMFSSSGPEVRSAALAAGADTYIDKGQRKCALAVAEACRSRSGDRPT